MKKLLIQQIFCVLAVLIFLTTCTHEDVLRLEPVAGLRLEMQDRAKTSLPENFDANVEVHVNDELNKTMQVHFELINGTYNTAECIEIPLDTDVKIRVTVNLDGNNWAGESEIFNIAEGDAPYLITITLVAIEDDDNGDDDINYGDGVTDIDGNEYVSVILGDQEWMAENLRVTRYNNGDAIPTGLSDTDWESTTDGAYAIYNNDNAMLEAYGKLYNWYAVDDAGGLCPTGWRVPTDAEWAELVNYVVGHGYHDEWDNPDPNGAGNALKSCRQVNHPDGGNCATSEHPRWNSHDTHYGFDEFGFSALPGGSRWGGGNFYYVGYDGCWWSSTEPYEADAWYLRLYYGTGNVNRGVYDKRNGFSVRCLRDID